MMIGHPEESSPGGHRWRCKDCPTLDESEVEGDGGGDSEAREAAYQEAEEEEEEDDSLIELDIRDHVNGRRVGPNRIICLARIRGLHEPGCRTV